MTKIYEIEGPIKWAKVFEHNRDLEGYEGEAKEYGGLYTVDVVLDDEAMQIFQDSGSKLEPKEDSEGDTVVKFKRKHEVRRKDTNELIEAFCGAPRVANGMDGQEPDKDGKYPDWISTEENPDLLGNGSRARVAFSVTPDKRKKSIVYTRLEGLLVLEQVEYDEEENGQGKLPF